MCVFLLLWMYGSLWSFGTAHEAGPAGISYEKRTAKYCPNEYESYNTLSLAQAACNYDSKCRGVYDGNCDNSTLSLCPLSEELQTSASGSCVYEKIGCRVNGRSGDGTRQGTCISSDNVCHADGKCRATDQKCPDKAVVKDDLCHDIDSSLDCCSPLIQNLCPGSCNTCPPTDCEWSSWTPGVCSVTCGIGTKNNTRVKIVEEANGGKCHGEDTDICECIEPECPIRCEWNEWTPGGCTKTCGGGTRQKDRTEKISASHGGEKCQGPSSEEESCNNQPCPVDCEWSGWTFTRCSVTCGNGFKEKTRFKIKNENHGGEPCAGHHSALVSCTIHHSPCTICPECNDGNMTCPIGEKCIGEKCYDTGECCTTGTSNPVSQECTGLCITNNNKASLPNIITNQGRYQGVCAKHEAVIEKCTGEPQKGCEGVKDLDGTFCQKNANRCTEPDIRKVCPQTCGDCVCGDIYQTPYCQMLAKADYAAGCITKCCGKLDGNFWNIQGTQEDKRKILKKECYKTCEYCEARNYTLLSCGKSCDDLPGTKSVESEDKCKDIQQSLNTYGSFYTETDALWPKGCYASGGAVYWNKHGSGKNNSIARIICLEDGTTTDISKTTIAPEETTTAVPTTTPVPDAYSKMCDQCWCGEPNRYDMQISLSLEDCKSLCNNDVNCKGIEHWAGGPMGCYKCSTPDKTSYFTGQSHWYPPSVYRKGDCGTKTYAPLSCGFFAPCFPGCWRTCNEEPESSHCKDGLATDIPTTTLAPVDCQWNNWILGDCSKTCGGGIRTNTRTKKVLSANGGDDCDGPASVNENCNVQACPVVNGGWGNWRPIGKCNRNCFKQSKRDCNRPAPGPGGKNCPGSKTKWAPCGKDFIPPKMNCKRVTCAKLARTNKCSKKFNQALSKWCYSKLTGWYQNQLIKNHCRRSCKNC